MKISNLIIFFLSLSFYISSCHHSKSKNDTITIDLQPFSDISKEAKNYVAKELKKVYPHVELKDPIKLPQSAFYPKRNRYRADSLIRYLSRRTKNGHVTIGLTTKDISTTTDSVADWGVMGLGFCPGNACVTSSFRLSEDEKLMQLFKVSIHELGHTQGLPHYSVKSCFMRDAEGRNPTNEEKEFCQTCKSFLIAKN